MTKTVDFRVVGDQTIHCSSCEARIDRALHRVPGVEEVHASAQTQHVVVTINPDQVGPEQIKAKLEQLGYEAVPAGGAA